jgi:outer membrane protein assembly factor BamB
MRHNSLLTWIAAGALGLSLSSGFTTHAADWPRYRGSNYNGISTESGWFGKWANGAPKELWKRNVGIGFSSVSVANGRLYTVGNDGKKKGGKDTVYCFDAVSGAEIWTYSYDQNLEDKYYEGGPGATPTVDGNHVFVAGKNGTVVCLDAEKGTEVWKRNIHKELDLELPEWGFNGSVHIEGSLAILNAGSYGLALDKSTGKEVWSTGKAAAGYGTPVPIDAGGKRALAMFTAKSVVAIDPSSGKSLWNHPWKTSYDVNAADPAVHGDHMYISSGYGSGGSGIQFGADSAKEVWKNKEIASHMASPIAVGNFIYGIDGSGGDKNSKLKCLELKTGKLVWSSPQAATGSLSIADGKILWITGTGELVIVEASPDAYKELARAQITGGKIWSPPVLSHGRLYVRTAKGDLVCVDIRGEKRSAPLQGAVDYPTL